MDRRKFSRILLAGSATILGLVVNARGGIAGESQPSMAAQRLFPTGLPGSEWKEFPAEGFAKSACGVIYRRKHRPQLGMPLGSVGTGRIDLQTDGTFGFCTAFNSYCPQRSLSNLPFLGMSVGNQLWLLSNVNGTYGEYVFNAFQIPTEVHYWGHYPVADLEF